MLMVIGKMKMAQSAMHDIAEDIVELVPQVLKEDGCVHYSCLLYTSPSPRDQRGSRMPSSA